MKISALFAFTLTAAAAISIVHFAGAEDAVFKNTSISNAAIKQYETIEIKTALRPCYKNPYDSHEVDLAAEITGPGKEVITVPAFYSAQDSLWKARFAPAKTGRYEYRLLLKAGSNRYKSDAGYFETIPGSGDGFLRKGSQNPFYPVFDSGRAFFGLGHNIAWVKNNGLSEYEKYFALLKENGCNMTRIWVNSPWTFDVETKRIGEYNAADCDKVDAVVALAERYGIYIILSLDSYGALMDESGPWNEEWWKRNPYNKENGGPCEKPGDFFTNKTAIKHYKDRLKFCVGHWSHSPNIMAFELWNEYDAPPDWTREMALYIKSINPHGQFITTSLGYPWTNNFDEQSVFGLGEIDIIEHHLYGQSTKDVIWKLITVNSEFSKTYNKYILVGEFGMDGHKNDAYIDEAGNGVAFHNSLWASALTRSFASSMNWWWDEYVKAKNLYPHYRALKNFLEGVKWDSKDVGFLKTTPVKVSRTGRSSYADVDVPTSDSWGERAYAEFTVCGNGDLLGGTVNRYLHGTSKQNIRLEPVFHVNYPVDGKFVFYVDKVSQGANLLVQVDEKNVFVLEFPAGPGKGRWKKSLYLARYGIYQCLYDTTVEIAIPRGRHVIKLSNTGKDWLGIRWITLTNYGSANFADARVVGLRVGNDILLWAQNKQYTWMNDINHIQPTAIKDAVFSVLDVENGAYDIEWWDTYEGRDVLREKASAENNELRVILPEFTKDIACKIRRVS